MNQNKDEFNFCHFCSNSSMFFKQYHIFLFINHVYLVKSDGLHELCFRFIYILYKNKKWNKDK